jgi:hypothetical protein
VRALTDISDLIRSRRTHKSFGPEPVAPAVVDELLELARWAPNHHRTNPWRFRVLGSRRDLVCLAVDVAPARPPRRYARRWIARLAEEQPLTLAELDLVVTALRALPSPGAVDALRALV